MAHRTVHRLACLVTLLAVTSAKKDQTRWSRQISTYTADISDWVPLSGPVEREPLLPPIKRQAVAEPRILTEPFPGLSRPTGFGQETFPSRTYYNSPVNRQLYLQSMPAVPSAPQNYLTDQGFGQSIRFGLSQPNLPLNQGFVAPQYSFENMPQIKQQVTRPQQVPQLVSQQGQYPQQVQGNPIKFESFQKPSIPASSQAKPFNNQLPKIRPEAPKFIDGYRAENASNDFAFIPKKKPQSLQKIKFENSDKSPKIETVSQNNQKLEREEVQLLYVPLEQLNRGQFNFKSPITSSQISNTDIFAQGIQRPSPLKQTLESEFQPKQIENYSRQEYFGNYNSPKEIDQTAKFTTVATPFPTQLPTSPKPKKLKPHQPPLAIFLTQEASRRNQVKVGDVLTSLKSANTIAVLDSVNPLNAPSVFIGPSHLTPPENYVRFELPYLSNIENTDKKLRQLPFFVAPLSYNTPQGFAKIPFPSPHVGSVVINSQIKETTAAPIKPAPTANIPNSYSPPLSYKQEQKPITQRPQVSFYSTNSPRTNSPTNNNYQSNYYSIEPQTVSTIRPPKEPEASISKNPPKAGYFLTNVENNSNQYNPPQYSNYPQESYKPEPVQSYKEPVQRYKEPAISYNIPKQAASTTTVRTTVSTTTKSPSTYPSQLLETHNPYSINQAFHFSTPLDYHNYFEENYATPPAAPEFNPSVSSPSPPISTTAPPKPEEVVTEKNKYQQQSSPNYLQNYSPEIHYESEVQNSRYPIYNSNDYTTKTELSSENTQPASPVYTDSSPPISSFNPTAYSENHETQPTVSQQSLKDEINKLPGSPDLETPPTQYESNLYETNYETEEYISTTPSTTTTSTRRPLRSRGRPRYTTTPRTDSNESSTRFAVTRRPLRERRPLPTRSRYEPNRITTEKPARKPIDSNESTTKSSKGRTRGRIHYKPSGNDETFERVKSHNSKEADLAYQRDVLHQNYPVTLMERTSTVDIEAITEPTPKVVPATNYLEPPTETYDAENAYTNERATITQHVPDTESKDDIHVPNFTSRTPQTESSYSRGQPTRNNEYSLYQSRSSLAPVDAISSYDETGADVEDNYQKPTTPVQNIEKEPEVLSYATELVSSFTEQSAPIYSRNNEFTTFKQEEVTTVAEIEESNAANHEENEETEPEENTVQTTPSYNRVRIRPGVIRQYHQSSSTESSKINQNRRRPAQAVTYRPAFDRRRTTMRIDEIEADLKTKQVHSRPDVQDYRHPIYKPEPTTEPSVTLPIAQGTTTKRGHFRRRRPSNAYTTSTEASVARKNNYEVKNRFRGRRPTEKPTDKPEVQTESTSTVRNTPYSRYSHRPRLSERYNKKPEPEETEDQDSNFSISRPEYAEPETEQWSSKISTDSFKPYNPNDIVDEQKVETTERKSDKDELDIITARNDEYDDILISVTPATNSRNTKKIPDIPPTLEALVEQSKVTKSDSNDKMSTFESMLEEVMKSLEEQDEDEYTSNVMKHKGGEIGEIPPERIISSGDINTTTPIQHETTTEPTAEEPGLINEDESDRKGRRRGFWKKVKVRPANADSIEVAESQYYSHTVNRLGQTVKQSKSVHDKTEKYEKPKIAVTTYKPSFQFIKNIFNSDDEPLPIIDVLPTVDIPKLNKPKQDKETLIEAEARLTSLIEKEAQDEKTEVSPGDFDLGTGSPDPSIDDAYYTTPTEPTTPSKTDITDRSDAFSFMDYLFGVTSDDSNTHIDSKNNETKTDVEITTEQLKNKIVTTDSTYIPEEITATVNSDISEAVTESIDVKKTNATESKLTEKVTDTTEISVVKVETSSVSSFMNPTNIVSTSMSTEISHETEICFRGKCIKTSKDIL